MGKIEDRPDAIKTPREEMEEQANIQGLFMIPEYEFEHCICSLNSADWSDTNGL